MTKAEFIEKMYLCAPDGTTRAQTARALDACIDALSETLESGDFVTLTGFGTFRLATRAARQGRNPRTGAVVNIPARTAVKFTPGKALKEAVSKYQEA